MEFVLFAALVVYLVPFVVAAARDHEHLHWILALDIALGWTGIGWLLALAWACLSADQLHRRRPAEVIPIETARRARGFGTPRSRPVLSDA